MTLFYKTGVRIRGVCPEIVEATRIVEQVLDEHGYDCIVTSTVDGEHSETSLHYIGHARDFRSRHIATRAEKRAIRDEVKARLAPLGGDIEFHLEAEGQPNEHFHMENQPKRSAGTL